MNNWCEMSLVKDSCQMILLPIMVIASTVNLSLNRNENKIWVALLCSSLRYILPNASIKKKE